MDSEVVLTPSALSRIDPPEVGLIGEEGQPAIALESI